MSRVFVTQQPRPNASGWTPNLTPASDFGTLRFVFEPEQRPSASPNQALRHAQVVLKDFDPDEDFVLWPNTGDPSAAWAVMLALAKKGVERIQTLYYERSLVNGVRDRRNGFYTPVVFHL